MPEETKNSVVSATDEDNTTLLHQAMIKEDYSKVEELLLTKKIDIESKNTFGITPLYMAALHNQVKIAKILLDQGADPNATSKGSTALEMAARQGNIQMLELLIDKKASINAENCFLLHEAARSIQDQEIEAEANDGWKVMKYLIQKCSLDPYKENKKGLTPKDILGEIDWSFEDYYEQLVDKWLKEEKNTQLSGDI